MKRSRLAQCSVIGFGMLHCAATWAAQDLPADVEALTAQVETNSSAIADLADDVAGIVPTSFLVIDGNQQIIGPASNVRATSATALLTIDGPLGQVTMSVAVGVDGQILDGGVNLVFESNDCSGDPFLARSKRVFSGFPSDPPSAIQGGHPLLWVCSANMCVRNGDVFVADGLADSGILRGSGSQWVSNSDPHCQTKSVRPDTFDYFPTSALFNFYILHPPPYDVVEPPLGMFDNAVQLTNRQAAQLLLKGK